MTIEEERNFKRLSLKYSDALKKISDLMTGGTGAVPERIRQILCSSSFHLGVAISAYKQRLSDPELDDKLRVVLEGQLRDCADLKQTLAYINVPPPPHIFAEFLIAA